MWCHKTVHWQLQLKQPLVLQNKSDPKFWYQTPNCLKLEKYIYKNVQLKCQHCHQRNSTEIFPLEMILTLIKKCKLFFFVLGKLLWNFHKFHCMLHWWKKQQQQQNIWLTSTTSLLLDPFLYPISLLSIFLTQNTFCINFRYFYLPYTSANLFCNFQDSEDIIEHHNASAYIVYHLYLLLL